MSKKITEKIRGRNVRLTRKRTKKATKKARVQLTAKRKLVRKKKRKLAKEKAELEAKALEVKEENRTCEACKFWGRTGELGMCIGPNPAEHAAPHDTCDDWSKIEAKALDPEAIKPEDIVVKGRSVGATTMAVDMAKQAAIEAQDNE